LLSGPKTKEFSSASCCCMLTIVCWRVYSFF